MQLNQAFSRIGLHGWQIDFPLPEDDLIRSLNARLPVMISATTSATGPFVVITGYTTLLDGAHLYKINDPRPGAGVVHRTYTQLLRYGGQPWLFTWIPRSTDWPQL